MTQIYCVLIVHTPFIRVNLSVRLNIFGVMNRGIVHGANRTRTVSAREGSTTVVAYACVVILIDLFGLLQNKCFVMCFRGSSIWLSYRKLTAGFEPLLRSGLWPCHSFE